MAARGSPRFDLGFGAFLVAVCAVVLWEARDIPPGSFEPLGSGPAPRAAAWHSIGLTLTVMLRAWRALRAAAPAGEPGVAPRWADAIMVGALTVVYALALHLRIGRFDVLSTCYLFVTIGLLLRFSRRSLPIVAVVSAIVGFGCQIVFTKVFIVDLPGAF